MLSWYKTTCAVFWDFGYHICRDLTKVLSFPDLKCSMNLLHCFSWCSTCLYPFSHYPLLMIIHQKYHSVDISWKFKNPCNIVTISTFSDLVKNIVFLPSSFAFCGDFKIRTYLSFINTFSLPTCQQHLGQCPLASTYEALPTPLASDLYMICYSVWLDFSI